MAENKKAAAPADPQTANITKPAPSNVVNLSTVKCVAEDCKKKPSKANFCDEHFVWFKEGLITTQGTKAKDFDKKYHAWLRRSKVA